MRNIKLSSIWRYMNLNFAPRMRLVNISILTCRFHNFASCVWQRCFKAFFDSACISSIVWKGCPRCGLLSLGNSQKSHGAKSGEYGGCGTICVEFLAKWSRRTSAVWDGAWSWCKNHELSAQNIFWNGVEWSSWNANSVSKVSNCQSTIFVH